MGSGRPVPMADLRALLAEMGLRKLQTYVQSGNVLFETEREDREALTGSIEAALADEFGFEIPVILLLPSELRELHAGNPFPAPEEGGPHRLYYVIWKRDPAPEIKEKLEAREFPEEAWSLGERCVYLYCKAGYGKAKLNNNVLERMGRMPATTRNDRTIRELLKRSREMAGD